MAKSDVFEREKVRVLALETSSREASIAICEATQLESLSASESEFSDRSGQQVTHDFIVVESLQLDSSVRTTKSLIPAIQAVLAKNEWPISSLDLIVTTAGPGSFTGLRIGVTTTKSLAYAIDASVCGISTLHLLAATVVELGSNNGDLEHSKLCALLDAQRNECFVQQFEFDLKKSEFGKSDSRVVLRPIDAVQIVEKTSLAKVIQPSSLICYSEPKLFTDQLLESLQVDFEVVPPTRLSPAVLARLGMTGKIKSGDQVFELRTEYHRKSAAEEKIDAQFKN